MIYQEKQKQRKETQTERTDRQIHKRKWTRESGQKDGKRGIERYTYASEIQGQKNRQIERQIDRQKREKFHRCKLNIFSDEKGVIGLKFWI